MKKEGSAVVIDFADVRARKETLKLLLAEIEAVRHAWRCGKISAQGAKDLLRRMLAAVREPAGNTEGGK